MIIEQLFGYGFKEMLRRAPRVGKRCGMRISPYFHEIYIAGDLEDYLTMRCYHATRVNTIKTGFDFNDYTDDELETMLNVADAVDVYKSSGGVTTTYMYNGVMFSVVGIPSSTLSFFNTASTRNFINTLTHEVQHALMSYAEWVGSTPVVESEPHAYLTGWVVSELLRVYSKTWNVEVHGVPKKLVNLNMVLINVANNPVFGEVSPTSLYSALINQTISERNTVVKQDGSDGWVATTYWMGQ